MIKDTTTTIRQRATGSKTSSPTNHTTTSWRLFNLDNKNLAQLIQNRDRIAKELLTLEKQLKEQQNNLRELKTSHQIIKETKTQISIQIKNLSININKLEKTQSACKKDTPEYEENQKKINENITTIEKFETYLNKLNSLSIRDEFHETKQTINFLESDVNELKEHLNTLNSKIFLIRWEKIEITNENLAEISENIINLISIIEDKEAELLNYNPSLEYKKFIYATKTLLSACKIAIHTFHYMRVASKDLTLTRDEEKKRNHEFASVFLNSSQTISTLLENWITVCAPLSLSLQATDQFNQLIKKCQNPSTSKTAVAFDLLRLSSTIGMIIINLTKITTPIPFAITLGAFTVVDIFSRLPWNCPTKTESSHDEYHLLEEGLLSPPINAYSTQSHHSSSTSFIADPKTEEEIESNNLEIEKNISSILHAKVSLL